MSRVCWVSAISLAALGVASPSAFAANVSLDNLKIPGKDGQETVIQHVDITDTNITADEARKIFASDTLPADRAAIVAKMTAARLSIPLISGTAKDGIATIKDVTADGINAGTAAHAKVGSVEGGGTDSSGKPLSFKTGALTLDGWDFRNMLAAAQSGSPMAGLGRVDHINFGGFDVSFASDTTPPGTAWHATLASMDAKSTYAGTTPLTGQLEIKGLVVEPPKGSPEAAQFASFGYDKIELGITSAGTYDPTAKTAALTDFTITSPRAGALTLKGDFGGIAPDTFTGGDQSAKMSALINSSISALQLRYADSGLLNNIAAFVGKMQNKTPDALRREWSGMATQFAPMLLGGDPSSLKIAGALGSFVSKGGTLAITVKAKSGAVKVMDLMGIRSPQDALAVIDLDAQAGP